MFGKFFGKKRNDQNTYRRVNQDNSTLGVQCVAKGKCEMRFTTLCDTCRNNSGMKRDVNYYEPR